MDKKAYFGFLLTPRTMCCKVKKTYWHYIKHVAEREFLLPLKHNFLDSDN